MTIQIALPFTLKAIFAEPFHPPGAFLLNKFILRALACARHMSAGSTFEWSTKAAGAGSRHGRHSE